MLPSRMFRNVGIPPPLRSLIIPHASFPPHMKTMIRLGLGRVSGSTITLRAPQRAYSSQSSSSTEEELTITSDGPAKPLQEKMEPRISLTFTCTADNCGTRSTHQCSKQAYTKGIVLVECPGCKNRHLIADHLGWFKESTDGGQMRTIEDILNAKGERVQRGRVDPTNGDIEYYEQ